MVQPQQHDIVQQAAVELDVQHTVHPHQIVGRCQRLPSRIFHGSSLSGQVIDHKYIVPAAALVRLKAFRFVHQIEDAANAAADVAHTFALVGVIRSQR